MKKYILLLFVLFLASSVFADDIDIYGVSSISVKPNVLIVFDNSGSMATKDVRSDVYDPTTTYPGSYGTNYVYIHTRRGNSLFFKDVNSSHWHDTGSQKTLLTQGYWTGKLSLVKGEVNSSSSGRSKDYRLGNYLNFLASSTVTKEQRIVVAKEVIAKLIYDNYNSVNFGIMKFNTETPRTYNGGTYDKKHESGYVVAPCGTPKTTLIGSYNPTSPNFTNSDQSGLGAIGDMWAETYTPLAETLAEAGLYFGGKKSWFNGTSSGTGYPYGHFDSACANSPGGSSCQDYSSNSPIQYRCQKNYIIIVTDGSPTRDNFADLKTKKYMNGIKIPDAGKDGKSNYLEDISYFLANEDLRSDLGKAGDFPDQTVTTYTIGFATHLPFLEQVATNGNGKYYSANSAATLGEALNNIITAIGESNEQFSSSAVPVNSDDGFTAGDYVYFGLFQPLTNDNWAGNLKKYALTNGVIEDKNNVSAVLPSGVFKSTSTSYWSSGADGDFVTAGGAGEVLSTDLANGTPRHVYTYTGTNHSLTDSSNLFETSNTALTSGTYSGLTTSVISAVRHDNGTGEWPLGSFIHSEPLVLHYGTTQTMIYIGANDGMLHCFDDADGSEKWGFIPQDLLANLSVLESPTQLHYFVDGSPSVFTYEESGVEKRVLIFGERRGGYSYTALDVSNPSTPSFKYSIDSNFLSASGGETLGQSWGKPQHCKMFDSTSSTVKDVFVLPGGYDTNEDNNPLTVSDTVGRAIFAVDSKNGTLFSDFGLDHSDFSSMNSIVAVAAFENPASRTATRVYAGDLGGNMFATRDDEYGGAEDGVWQQKIKLFSSPGKKIFYPPNITNEYFWVKYPFVGPRPTPTPTTPPVLKRIKGDYVFYGTGDRAHPERTDITNDFYAIKNNWQWEDSTGKAITSPTIVKAYVDKTDGHIKDVATNSDIATDDLFILNVTDDLYQNTETVAATKTLYTNYIKLAIENPNNRGWYFELLEDDGSKAGEKIVSSPIIFNGVVYFTTYVPDNSTTTTSDPCANPGSSGTGYIYAVGYKYGGSVMNLDQDSAGEITKTDRRFALKTSGVPPEPRIVTPKSGDPYLIIGKQKLGLPPLKGVHLFYWRQLNN